MIHVLLLAAAAAAAAPADAVFETYACDSGPSVTLALTGGRPASGGYLRTDGAVVALTPHAGDAKTVLRGGGYMVRASNWADILYAPPGREKNAYECRVANAAVKPGAPKPE